MRLNERIRKLEERLKLCNDDVELIAIIDDIDRTGDEESNFILIENNKARNISEQEYNRIVARIAKARNVEFEITVDGE